MRTVFVITSVEDELGFSTLGAEEGGSPSAGPSYILLSREYVGKSSVLRRVVGGCSMSSCDRGRDSPGGAPESTGLAGSPGPAGPAPPSSVGGAGGGGLNSDGGSMKGVKDLDRKKSSL